jgi:hypothetical protein
MKVRKIALQLSMACVKPQLCVVGCMCGLPEVSVTAECQHLRSTCTIFKLWEGTVDLFWGRQDVAGLVTDAIGRFLWQVNGQT